MRNFKRCLSRVVVLLLCALLISAETMPVLALSQKDIDNLKDDAAELVEQRKELEQQLKELKGDKAEVLTRRKKLDEQISTTSAQIENTEAQIAAYAELITEAEAKLADAEKREADQYDLFCQRVRAMEERGKVDYWSVLFRASSFSDLLGRLDIVNEIMAYDQRVIAELKTLQTEITAQKESLEDSKLQSEAAKAELEERKGELNTQRQEATALVSEIQSNEAEYKATINELEAEEERILAEAIRLSKELAKQQAASDPTTGGYIWPVNSRYITSTVGGRTSPGGVGSTNHKGTDIGRVGYTSEIYAAKAGTVIVSQYSSSYGNYVVVAHGSGNTTLYAHMSKRKVSVGQYVNQGDVLGITGSTGNSTGPHLHFEITENDVRINPLSHGAEPRKGYLTGYTLSGTSIGK